MKLFVRGVLLIVAGLLCVGARTVRQVEDKVMGSIRAKITAVSDQMPAEEIESALSAALAEIHRIDRLMSNYKKDSDVSRLNESDADVWVQVNPMTFTVLQESQRISELTGGAFDATALPLSGLWGFWPKREVHLPSEEEIRHTLSHVGYHNLSLDPGNHTLKKSDPETKVDLGGIAKGYAVDRAIEVLRQKGLRDALVEIGGEVRTMGKNKNGDPWRIGVLHPNQWGYLTVLELSDKAAATSGDYMNFFVVEGKRYCHLIDPRAGKPISNDLCSATVVARECTEADALATAILIVGAEEGLKLIESLPDREVIIVRRVSEKNEIDVSVSSGLKGLSIRP